MHPTIKIGRNQKLMLSLLAAFIEQILADRKRKIGYSQSLELNGENKEVPQNKNSVDYSGRRRA